MPLRGVNAPGIINTSASPAFRPTQLRPVAKGLFRESTNSQFLHLRGAVSSDKRPESLQHRRFDATMMVLQDQLYQRQVLLMQRVISILHYR
jgi:hypothetical protein